VHLFVWWGAISFPGTCWCYFGGVLRLPIRLVVLVLVLGLRLLSFPLPAVVTFLCRGLLPRMQMLSLPPFLCGLREEWGRRDGQAAQWPGKVCNSHCEPIAISSS
jgi:hypothetical protein